MFLSTTFGINANETSNQRKDYYESIIPQTIELLDSFFMSSEENVKVINVNNEDKGIEFKQKNTENFEKGAWDEIITDYINNDYRMLVVREELNIEVKPRANQNISKTYRSNVYLLLTIDGRGASEIPYDLSGNASENMATGVYSSASMSIYVINRPGTWVQWGANLNYNTEFSASRRSVSFKYVYLNVWGSGYYNNIYAKIDYDEVYLGALFEL